MRLSNKSMGFTLAEVLITLGIIGVVAAMTMPTLMNSTQGAQYKAAYKKALSAISQGVTLNVALDGESFAGGSAQTILKDRMNIVNTRNDGLGYALSSIKTAGLPATTTTTTEGNTALFFSDGIVFSYETGKTSCTALENGEPKYSGTVKATGDTRCWGFIDVNGAKGPNKEVPCDGDDGTTHTANCKVSTPGDIYPVIYYDQTIVPATQAAAAVLYGK